MGTYERPGRCQPSPFTIRCKVVYAGIGDTRNIPRSIHRYIKIETYIVYMKVCFWPFGIFLSSGRASFLVLSAPWHAGSSPGPRKQVWALAGVRGTCSGSANW